MDAPTSRTERVFAARRRVAQRRGRRLGVRADVSDLGRHRRAHAVRLSRSPASPRWCRCRSSGCVFLQVRARRAPRGASCKCEMVLQPLAAARPRSSADWRVFSRRWPRVLFALHRPSARGRISCALSRPRSSRASRAFTRSTFGPSSCWSSSVRQRPRSRSLRQAGVALLRPRARAAEPAARGSRSRSSCSLSQRSTARCGSRRGAAHRRHRDDRRWCSAGSCSACRSPIALLASGFMGLAAAQAGLRDRDAHARARRPTARSATTCSRPCRCSC